MTGMYAAEQIVRSQDASSQDKTPLKLLMLIDGMDSLTAGGTERQFLQLAQIAKRNGAMPVIAALRGTEWLTEEAAGCKVRHFDLQTLKSPRGLQEIFSLLRWIRAERFDVLQTYFWDANLIGPFLGRLAGVPVIVGTRRCLSDPDRSRNLRWLYPLRNAMVDHLLVNSGAVLQSVLSVEGFSRSKIDIVYNGLDLTTFREHQGDGARVRKALHILPDEILVGNVSGLRKVKGLETFILAARIACDAASNLRFAIVGEGEMRPVLESMIARYGLRHRIVLCGAQQDVSAYLAAMDIAVLSSTAEGLSNSLLEYMAAGLPVIATDVGGNREAIEDTGILVSPGSPEELANAILSLCDRSVRQEMGNVSYQSAERFDIKLAEAAMANHYRNYAGIVKRRRRVK